MSHQKLLVALAAVSLTGCPETVVLGKLLPEETPIDAGVSSPPPETCLSPYCVIAPVAGPTCSNGAFSFDCAKPRCLSSGWCWENPKPSGQALRQVFAISSTEVWAIGGDETDAIVLRLFGTVWREVTPPGLKTPSALWGTASGQVWLAERTGRVWHFDGIDWSVAQTSPSTHWFWVTGTSPSDVWVVGHDLDQDEVVASHFDGVSWTRHHPPVHGSYGTALALSVSANDFWLIANDHMSADGGLRWTNEIARWNGATWSSLPVPDDMQEVFFTSVAASGPGQVWFSGGNQLIQWNGVSFESHDSSIPNRIFATTDGLWTVDYRGRLFRWVMGQWVQVAVHPGYKELLYSGHPWAIGGTSSTDLWLAGPGLDLLHWDGNALTTVRPRPVNEDLLSIDGRVANDLWIGAAGHVLQYDGQRWIQHRLERSEYFRTFVASDGTAFALSETSLFRYSEGTWRREPLGVWSGLRGIHGSTINNLWVVTTHGNVLHFNGQVWSSVDLGQNLALTDVFVLGETNVWVAGRRGALLQWNGARWIQLSSPAGDADIESLWASDPNSVWAVTLNQLLHWDGARWSTVTLPPGFKVFGPMVGTGPNDLWAWGRSAEGPAMIHFDGSKWSAEAMTSVHQFGTWVSQHDVISVGLDGSLLRKRR